MEHTATIGCCAESGQRSADGADGKDQERIPWQAVHEELLRLVVKRGGLDFEEGQWLVRAYRWGVHARLGFGSFYEYTERLFGYGVRLTQEKLRVAEALEELPQLARALREGTMSFSAVRELTRVATPRTESEWHEVAQGRTIREIERLVSGLRPGSRPDDPQDPGARRHVLRLEVSGETLATWREAMAKIRRDAGGSLAEDSALLLLARSILEGPRDAGPSEAGRSSYQVALTICEECRRGRQQGQGELVAVAPEIVEMARCDGQELGHGEEPRAHVGAPQRAAQSITPAIRRSVLRRDGGRCQVPGCRHATFVDVHHLVPRSEGGANTAENLVTLCSAHHRAVHRGKVITKGHAPDVRFFHANGTIYGESLTSAQAVSRTRARSALVAMGYGVREARLAVDRAPSDAGASAETLIRAALRELARAA